MKTETILSAMTALKNADRFLLACQHPGAVALSGECFDAYLNLRIDLLRELPDIEIKGDK